MKRSHYKTTHCHVRSLQLGTVTLALTPSEIFSGSLALSLFNLLSRRLPRRQVHINHVWVFEALDMELIIQIRSYPSSPKVVTPIYLFRVFSNPKTHKGPIEEANKWKSAPHESRGQQVFPPEAANSLGDEPTIVTRAGGPLPTTNIPRYVIIIHSHCGHFRS